MTLLAEVLLVPGIPLAIAALLGAMHLFAARPQGRRAPEGLVTAIAVGAMLVVTGLAAHLLLLVRDQGLLAPATWNWLPLGAALPPIPLTIQLDSLSAVMIGVVAVVSTLVQLYSSAYMAGDAGFTKFFSFLNLFTFAMLGLVVVDNFLGAYIFWELVGLGSYLLIGFWYTKPEAVAANLKAFVVNRVGDFGFLLGILLLFATFHTFDFGGLQLAVHHLDAVQPVFGLAPLTALGLAMVLVTWGPIGKSAQFPLHVWLPDAMEGPTPVSALIHAATMVAAGVYLVARCMFLYAAAPSYATTFVAWIGGFTALFAATIALAQWDIKRILAYSTVSQLGYMVLALGLGPLGLVAALFHLVNHAFFKALLFLGSGSVIHGTATQDIREMGGLRKFMPVTFWTFTLAVLSISGFPLLSGFWSKDAILAVAFTQNKPLYLIGSFVAVLTAFYMTRLWAYTFVGTYRGGHGVHPHAVHAESEEGGLPAGAEGLPGHGSGTAGAAAKDPHGSHGHAPHESPWPMTVPLLLLAIPTVLSGLLGLPREGAPGGAFGTYLLARLAHPPAIPAVAGGNETLVMGVSTALALLGIGAAYAAYRTYRPADALEVLGPLWTAMSRKWYVDELYDRTVVALTLGLGRGLALFDRYVVDGLVNAVGLANLAGSEGLRLSQTGKPQGGVWVAAGAVTVFAALFAIFGWGH